MKIVRVEAIPVRLPMLRPMKMAGVVIAEAENLIVRIEAEDGSVGWGESASAPTMTGELPAGMTAAVNYLAPMLVGQAVDNPGALAVIGAMAHRRLHGNSSAHAAIDMALHDLLGKARGLPIHVLLGDPRRSRVPVLWMLGTGQLASDVAEAKEKAGQGCIAFKVKVGIDDPVADAARTRAVREALGPEVLICADANQGWNYAQATTYHTALDGCRLDFLEQPLPGDDLEGMARLAASTSIPIGCDEGIHSSFDIRQHHARGAAAGCSLKAIKLGGVRAVYDAALLCQSLGMKVNLACKVAESGIASAAVLQLAAALPSLDWGLSLSCQYLKEDVVRRPIRIERGHADVPTGAGLGIDVDEAQIDRFRCSG